MKIEESVFFGKPIRSLSRWYGNLTRDEVKGEALRTRIRMCVAPAKTKRRLAAARPFLSSQYDGFRRNGHLAMRLPGYERLTPVFRRIIEESLCGDRPQAGSKKNLINLLKPGHLTRHPEIMDAIFDEAFLLPVFNYYGYAPELASLGLFLTPQNEDVEKSQLWHIDSYDPHHLKHITLVEDVTMDNGPFTFLPIPESNAIRQAVGKLSRGLDFESKFADRLRNNIAHVGSAGEGMFVDVSQCLHQGGRTRAGRRILFFVHFATFADYLQVEKNYQTGLFFQHEPELVEQFATDPVRAIMLRRD